jgi:predicted esterase
LKNAIAKLLLLLVVGVNTWADDEPRKGYFQLSYTPIELLGEDGAKAIASVFDSDAELTWQLSVPKTYDPTKPAGAMVFVGFAEWGGGKRTWTPVLEEQNLIWIGLIGGGDKKPLNERMLKAILAQAVLAKDYNINSERYYLFGYSGGAHVAAILATTKPETFKGALYYGDALPWGRKLPSKIDLVKQNSFMFMAGSRDNDVRKMKAVADAYTRAGITNTHYELIANVGREMPTASYFRAAIQHLDSASSVEGEKE